MEQHNQFSEMLSDHLTQSQNDRLDPQAQAQIDQPIAQNDHLVLRVPEHIPLLMVSDSALAIWNNTSQTARYRVQTHRSILPHEPIHATEADICWLTLLALQREKELEEMMRYLDDAQRELDEIRKLLGMRRR